MIPWGNLVLALAFSKNLSLKITSPFEEKVDLWGNGERWKKPKPNVGLGMPEFTTTHWDVHGTYSSNWIRTPYISI